MVHENLKKIRIAKGVTQVHLAKKLNVTPMTYSRMENGDSKIDVERMKILSQALETDIEVFFNNKLTESVILKMKFQKEVV
ncbi:helix-turn-helix domain-containing protein [Sporosarcina sp. P17b]|uniref:helix-turn-helix domain-containing protein n=1 Tax=Sporosarcina sp. P17b TaxID=2048260 RepID=UPI000C173260|nr:helix-turn-helix transcriptional regulator [Sporosarcina sp. P17b]PIC72489.1 transcriptional regulator [Sporosarcina sp. P17b]